jgi:putative hydrolase of the HAD superfamily
MAARVRAVLSDLDDTLFDHTASTRGALAAVRAHVPDLAAVSLDDLATRHSVLLERLHADVLSGRMAIDAARRERFRLLLSDFGGRVPDALSADVAAVYRAAYEASWQPVAGALALLHAIKCQGLALVIVTNNVVAEQRIKLERCGLWPLVDALVASEEAGVAKPDPRIFDHALERARVRADEAVMIGDAWATDIEGARASGVRAVWFNRTGAAAPDPSVAELRSLEPVEAALACLLAAADQGAACERV